MKENTHPADEPKSLKSFKTAFLVGIYPSGGNKLLCDEYLEELRRLCDTFGLKALAKESCPIKKLDAGMYLGKGKLDEIKAKVLDLDAEVIIFDDEISPHQQRNLEQFFQKPVIDRTELIIEVFAQRAQTKEARLQVEMAKIKYQFPRLKRLWTHLSRQVAGGGGFLKGEGEKQIELDRRMLRKKVDQLKKEIEEVSAKRKTQRSARIRIGIPTFAIVGYTNAGKSTLLNTLTKSDVLAEDKLFATLDTTTRKYILPNRQEILLVDTVGFIRKIPHTLVAAFKSTLEEAIHTDILLHLVDISHPLAEEHAEATYEVLKELGVSSQPIITVFTKIDENQNLSVLSKLKVKYPRTVQISAMKGIGIDKLLELMMQEVSKLRKIVRLKIPQSHYALVSELMKEGRVVSSEYEQNDILLEIEIPARLEYKTAPFLVS